MRQVFRKIPVYTGDVSGVCSALFELGGMVVMHDPSGCNSTYNTHDEIRWYDHDSLIFISGLNEMEAIMGSDEDLIRDITESAGIYSPKFIAIANSPIPYITGMDFDAISRLVEEQTGIPAFYITTNGMHDYTRGAGLAFKQLARNFVMSPAPNGAENNIPAIGKNSCEQEKETFPASDLEKIGKRPLRCNILGMTPLDFASSTSLASLRTKVEAAGFEIVSCWAMGDDLEHIQASARADVNLVVASSGLAAAQYLFRKFGIPFTAGIPAESTEEIYFEAARMAAQTGENQFPFRDRQGMSKDPASAGTAEGTSYSKADGTNNQKKFPEHDPVPVCFIGEPVIMTSLAAQVQLRTGARTYVFGATEEAQIFLGEQDAALCGEEELEEALAGLVRQEDAAGKISPNTADHGEKEKSVRLRVAADPYYKDVFPEGCELISLPHLAFSGRILLGEIPDLFRFIIK